MTRRRKQPRISDREFVRALQIIRLQGLESGEYVPMSDREEMYLRGLRTGVRVSIEDFVVSKPLLLLESARRRAAEADDAAIAPR